MRPMLIGAPAIEPVSLMEMKSWLREDGDDEDQLIQALIASARMTLEAYTRRFFITQSWRIVLDAWPTDASILEIPFSPFQAITAIRTYDAADVSSTIDPASYRAPPSSTGGRLFFKTARPSPGRSVDGIEIDFVVGFGTTAVQTPEPLRRAIMTLVTHWRENRGDAGDDAWPGAVFHLATPFRKARLT